MNYVICEYTGEQNINAREWQWRVTCVQTMKGDKTGLGRETENEKTDRQDVSVSLDLLGGTSVGRTTEKWGGLDMDNVDMLVQIQHQKEQKIR